MSGLFRFVKSFFPAHDVSRRSIPETDRHQEQDMSEEEEYHQSLSSMASPAISVTTPRGSERSAEASAEPATDSSVIRYEEWKSIRNERLMHFMQQRIAGKDDEQDDYDDDEQGEEEAMMLGQGQDSQPSVPENDELDVPFWSTQQEASQPTSEDSQTQTQEPAVNATPSTGTSKQSPRTHTHKRIPRLTETNHVTTSLAQLDLYTSQLSLKLCRIDKIWPLRHTRRAADQRASSTCGSSIDSLSTSFGSFQDDGPLSTLYKNVFSLQITSLEPPALLGRAPRTAHVFVYNRYAILLHAWMESQPQGDGLWLMSLHDVPARCILPHEPQTWLAMETHVPYCICLGDKSSMKMDHGDGDLVRVRFDAPDMKVTVYRGQRPNASSSHSKSNVLPLQGNEVDVGPKETEAKAQLLLTPKTTSVLEERFREWEAAQQDMKEAKGEETEPTAPVAVASTRGDAQQRPEGRSATEASPVEQAQERGGSAKRTAPQARQERRNSGPSEAGQGADERIVKRPRTTVVYHKLNELRKVYDDHKASSSTSKSVQPIVNIYGTVLAFSAPSLTKANDWVLKVSLVDETLPLPDTDGELKDESVVSFTVVIFCPDRSRLPKLQMAGDVLRLHRVGIQEYQEEIQILGKRASSYLVIRPKNAESASSTREDDWEMVPTARVEYTVEPQDAVRASELWRWGQGRLALYPTMKFSRRIKLADLTRQHENEATAESPHGDLTVLVSCILPVPPALKTALLPIGFLRVWDGTGPPESDPLPVASSTAADAVRQGDPSQDSVVSVSRIIQALHSEQIGENSQSAESSSANIAMESPRALCGRVANLAVWEEPHWEIVTSRLRAGSFILLRHVKENSLFSGLRCLMLSDKSWLTPLPGCTFEIRTLLQEHNGRMLRKEPFNPQSGLLPLEDDGRNEVMNVGPGTVLASAGVEPCISRCITEPAPSSFVLQQFRITDTFPRATGTVDGFRRLCAPSQSGTSSSTIFQFAVHLRDTTGEIDAIVSNEVGELLLGMTAAEARELSPIRMDEVMTELMGADNLWKGMVSSVEVNGAKYFILSRPGRAVSG